MNESDIPLMFRAQIQGRCQLQYLPRRGEPDSVRWVDEWVDKAYPECPDFGDEVQTWTYEVSWRFVTNAGQDDGIIRPVIGAYGWPFYPGSSMKGAFRQACRTLEKTGEIPTGTCHQLCGDDTQLNPGILRFHGGYPDNLDWQKQLIDVVHPQQQWQVETQDTKNKRGGAFAQISLYQPKLKFGFSCCEPKTVEWDLIKRIWEQALEQGLGCRISSGYGQFTQAQTSVLYSAELKGRGPISMSIDRTLEFRPNIFRGAIRGHALRIFGGLLDEKQAVQVVEQLFGGISNKKAQWGLLQMNFVTHQLRVDEHDQTYRIEGRLDWSLTQKLSEEKQNCIKKLIRKLVQFAMLLGGFGKSWRRVDHDTFFPEYDRQIIGCHWEWKNPTKKTPVLGLKGVTKFLDGLQEIAREWLQLCGISPGPKSARWREAWKPSQVQVWGRMAGKPPKNGEPMVRGNDDCRAVSWFHSYYTQDYRNGRWIDKSIKKSALTGSLNQIGRTWHRMYPHVALFKDRQDPTQRIKKATPFYLEFLTIFPDQSQTSVEFLKFLQSEQSGFEQVWGESKS